MKPVVHTVLVVVSKPLERDLLLMALRRIEGLALFSTLEGSETMALVKKHQPDLLILDLFLPGLDGLRVLKQVRKAGTHKQPEVIVISSMAFPGVVSQAARNGAAAFLAKPVDPELLVDRVKKVLSNH